MFFLLFKVTVLLLTGLVALLATRGAGAGTRHLLCVCTLAGALLLPLGSLIPTRPIAFHTKALDTAVRQSPAISQAAALPWAAMLLTAWVLGTVLLLLRLAFGYWRVSRLVRSARLIEKPLFAADVNVPIVSGLSRPVVLLPRSVEGWPESRLSAAIRHELAHIERGDLWANLLASIACAIYWFHPLAWKVAGHLRREQESACDDAVIEAGFEPAAYAEALLSVAVNSAPTLIPGCAMTTQNDLKSRITRVLETRTRPRTTFRRTAAAFAGIVLAFAALTPVHAQKIYKVGGDVTVPRVLDKVDPAYTDEASQAKIQGTVVLSMIIKVDGMAHDIEVKKSLDPGLDRKAAEAVEQWHFAPATLNGEPVAVEATIEVNFRLK